MNLHQEPAPWSLRRLHFAWAQLAKSPPRFDQEAAEHARLRRNPNSAMQLLHRQLEDGSYRAQALRPVALPKPNGKTRLLLIPALLDRVAQSAVAGWLSDTLDRRFSPASFAYRPGLGVADALAQAQQHVDEGYGWALHADIADFFDSVPHASVITALKRADVWHNRLAWLLRHWLRASVMASPAHGFDAPASLVAGLPQGSPLSPVLSNLVLHEFDLALHQAGYPHVRYADDFVVFSVSEPATQAAQARCSALLGPMGLRLNDSKTRIQSCATPVAFLGKHFSGGRPVALREQLPTTVMPPTTAHPAPDTGPMTAATPATAPSTPAELSVPVPPASNADQPTPSQPTEVVQTTASEPPQAAIGSHGDPLLRTLYLLEHNTHLTREGDTLVVEPGNGKPAVHVPSARVHQIMAFGAVNLSSGAISLCLERAIPVMLLSGRGRYFGVIDPLRLDNLKLLQAQFAAIGNSATTLALSQAVVAGKIANSQRMLQRWARHRHIEDIKEVLDRMNQYANGARRATDTDQLMGYEGKAAAQYWQTLAKLIGKEWQFSGRKRRPPPDPVNSLLSYGYTLLYYNLLTLVLARGLHPHAGFYHVSRGGHHALVSDLMEEFRAIVVDAIVMDLVLNQRLTPDHFNWPEADGEPCLLSDVARRKLIDAFEARMNAPISHPDVHQRLDYRRVMDMQVLSLCSVLRGTATHYHAFTPR